MHDVLVINGTVVTEEGVRDADVAVAGEQIAAVEPPGATRLRGGPPDRRPGHARAPGRGRPARALRARGARGSIRERRHVDRRHVRWQHDRDRLRLSGAARQRARHDRGQEGDLRGPHGPRLGPARHPGGRDPIRGDGGDRRRRPGRHPDDQDHDDVRLDVRRRPPLRRHVRRRRGRWAQRHPRRGRRDRALVDEEVRAGGQDARGVHRRDAALARRGSRGAPRTPACGAVWLRALHPAYGRGGRRRRARRSARQGPAVLRRDADALPLLHRRRAVGGRARASLQQLPHDQDAGRPGRAVGGDRATIGCRP